MFGRMRDSAQGQALEALDSRYQELAKQLQHYRQEYLRVQELYADDADTLVPHLQRLSALLDVIKAEIVGVYEKKKVLEEEIRVQSEQRVVWRNFFFRIKKVG